MPHQEITHEETSPPTDEEIRWAKRVLGGAERRLKEAKTRFDNGETTSLEVPHTTEKLRKAIAILLKADAVSGKDMLAIGEILGEEEKPNGSHYNGIIHPGDEFE